jgi:hypothetical protein
MLSTKNAELEDLMTHFASAANYQASQTEEQSALFATTRAWATA